MDYARKTKEYQRAFDLLDEMCIICFKETNKETREAIKKEIKRRFESAKDDVERSVVLMVQQYLKGMSHYDIYRMAIEAKKKKHKKR